MSSLPAQSNALADHRHRITQDWLEDDAVIPAKLADSVYGGTPTTIDPDDAGAAGTAATVSRSDHQHQFTTATASALTETTTSGEGSAATAARSDHVHATNVLPWGVLANGRFTSTSPDSARAAGVDTDMTVTVALVTNRLYGAHLHTQVDYGTVTQPYALELEHDGTIIGRFFRWGSNETGGADDDVFCDAWVFFTVGSDDASATLTASNAAGSGGTIVCDAAAGNPRTLTVFDMGSV